MVGLSDIPCVGIVVDRVSVAVVDIALRGFRYLLCTKNLVKDLNSEIKKIEILENEFARKVDEAKNDGKIIEGHVLEWQDNVENIKTLAANISDNTTSCTCFTLHFPNPVARFRLGKRAAHLAKTVTEQTDSGKEFLSIQIAHHLPIESVPSSDTPYQQFGSRQEAYAKLWDSIVNEDGSPILGIYGMPGVGKTKMMEQLWKESMEKGIFNKVTRANVGAERINVTKLQDQLAGYLGCHLGSENSEARASQLKNSLINGGKTLVIFDDIWDDIPLNEIGIPFGDGTSKGCKILLASRRKDLCLRNRCEDPIGIKTLTVTEAWEMFKNTVGKSKIESFQDALLAEKVCKECGALPLLIHAVGKALKFGTENTWKDALHQLENQNFKEIDGIDAQVYACIQLSFLKLTEDARICLLLCSLFPEDADIEIRQLFDIATGSGQLDRGRNIGGLVDILKSSSLLLQGKDDDTVKLHDIIRDVARSVAAADIKYAFLFVRCKSRWPDNDDYSTRRLLHIDLEGDNVRFPDEDLVCQNLRTLWLQCSSHIQNRQSSFFNGFTNLRVVLLQGIRFSQQQFSIDRLDKLRMLSLENCGIDQICLNSVSRSLETLCIRYCNVPVPLDIPEFKDLIKLELVLGRRRHIDVVNGISKLVRLQELNVPNGFTTSENHFTSISAELSTLSYLRNLRIYVHPLFSFPFNIMDNLVEFRIEVGYMGFGGRQISKSSARGIKLGNIEMESRWRSLLEIADSVQLVEVRGLPINGLSDSCNMRREAFANLRELKIQYCNSMQHIARWDGRNQQQLKCFTNIRYLNVIGCNELEYVFSSRVATCLRQLQTLKVCLCREIEEIVRVDDGQEIISFPKLIHLDLFNLPRLTNLYNNNKVEFPQLKKIQVRCCEKLEVIFRCSMLHNLENIESLEIWRCDRLKRVFHYSSSTHTNMVFSALHVLSLESLPNLESFLSYDNEFLEINDSKSYILFTSSVFRSFQQLQKIKVSNCNLLKEIVEDGNGTHGINNRMTPSSLLELKEVILQDLPNLQNCGIFSYYMPALSVVEVRNCAISSLFTCSALVHFHNLKSLKVTKCRLLEQISVDDMDDGTPGPSEKIISLPLLTTIQLESLHGLKSFTSSSSLTSGRQHSTLR